MPGFLFSLQQWWVGKPVVETQDPRAVIRQLHRGLLGMGVGFCFTGLALDEKLEFSAQR